MKKTLLSVLFLLSPLFVSAAELNTLSPEEQAEGFMLLFDGKTVSPDIWSATSIKDGKQVGYLVEDGILIGKSGFLYSKKEYGDFVFRFEFQMTAGCNSGVALRAAPLWKDPAYYGMEIQTLDNSAPNYSKLKPEQFHGSIYGIVASKRDAAKNDFFKPLGEWNTQEITADGTHIRVVLNGVVILDTDIAVWKDKPLPDGKEHPGLFREKGWIGFLGHTGTVNYRNIRIKELNK